MEALMAFWGGMPRPANDLIQVSPLFAWAMGWSLWGVLVGGSCLGAWAAWRWRRELGHWLGLEHEVTARVVVTDPHGFHMRRCKDLVEVARKYVTYNIYVRPLAGGGKTWANARSIMSLTTLAVRGPRPGEPPPEVEVRVHGLRPRLVMQEIRQVLEEGAEKYLSVYELAELAEKTGGKIVVRTPTRTSLSRGQRVTRLLRSLMPRT
jgi:phosphotransferase system HPr-like phosphotransfer protein